MIFEAVWRHQRHMIMQVMRTHMILRAQKAILCVRTKTAQSARMHELYLQVYMHQMNFPEHPAPSVLWRNIITLDVFFVTSM